MALRRALLGLATSMLLSLTMAMDGQGFLAFKAQNKSSDVECGGWSCVDWVKKEFDSSSDEAAALRKCCGDGANAIIQQVASSAESTGQSISDSACQWLRQKHPGILANLREEACSKVGSFPWWAWVIVAFVLVGFLICVLLCCCRCLCCCCRSK